MSVSQDSRWNPILTVLARLTGGTWFWYVDLRGQRRLYFGDLQTVGLHGDWLRRVHR